MIRQIYSAFLVAAVFSVGCHSQKLPTESGQSVTVTNKLKTHMALAVQPVAKDSVMLSFTVINPTGKPQRFCKWETPFEPRLGKYFDIEDNKGSKAAFKGAMARRVMPPPPEAYIEVSAHDSVRTVINLANHYTFVADKYTLKYTGGGVSGLNAGNTIRITFNR